MESTSEPATLHRVPKRHRGPANSHKKQKAVPSGRVIDGRAQGLPGFKKFKRLTKIQALEMRLDTQAKLISRSVVFLDAFFNSLNKWVGEESWIVREVHSKTCDLENKLIVLPSCSCKPLKEYIWAGEQEHFGATHELLGKFESMLTGKGVSMQTQPTDQPQTQQGSHPISDVPVSGDVPSPGSELASSDQALAPSQG